MAITLSYVDFGAGNDYKGASFTDGAFTVADMTLTKAGAFAASKVNHYLYLQDNGSGQVTAGYYKISSVTSANAVVLATSPKSGATDPTDVKCTQAAGTTALPFRSVQGCLDLITRDATNGDQINVKSSTNQVNAAALALTTYGTPTKSAPLFIRGYTSAAGDGGIGNIDCNGVAMFASTTNTYVVLIDLKIHNGGNNNLINLGGAGCVVYHCEVTRGASSPSGKTLLLTIMVENCYVHDAGTSGTGIGAQVVRSCYVTGCPSAGIYGSTNNATIEDNIVVCDANVTYGMYSNTSTTIFRNNAIYSTVANTGTGINAAVTANRTNSIVINNIIVGFSGVGGKGIVAADMLGFCGYNAFYNNTANYSISNVLVDLTANDVALAADPFTSAATGDFSLTAAAKTALRGLGWPAAYLGAHANTDGHITIGAIQYGEAESSISMPRVRVGH